MNDPVIRTIPLDRLERSPANVRRTEAGKAAFAELKASIAAHGLLENLLARSIVPGKEGGERYAVIAGARRLSALNDLARDVWERAEAHVAPRAVDGPPPDPVLRDRLSLGRFADSEAQSVLVAVDAGPVNGTDEGCGQSVRVRGFDRGLRGNRTLAGHAAFSLTDSLTSSENR